MPATLELVDPAQQGFLWGRNGAKHTLDINSFFYEGVVKKLERFVFFLDTAKAFDSIDHAWIFKVLKRAAYPPWVSNFVRCSLTEVLVSPFFGTLSDVWIPMQPLFPCC